MGETPRQGIQLRVSYKRLMHVLIYVTFGGKHIEMSGILHGRGRTHGTTL